MNTAQVKAAFSARGITVTAWAKQHGFSRSKVSLVLNGRAAGIYGQAHTIKRMLGMIDGKIQW